MPIPDFDRNMTPPVRVLTADCSDTISTSATWALPAATGTIVPLGTGATPKFGLQHHGWLHWVISGSLAVGTGNTFRWQPRVDDALATGAGVLNFPIGDIVSSTAYFVFEALMVVHGSTAGVDRQTWRGRLTIYNGSATPSYDVTLVSTSTVTQVDAHKVGWGVALPAGTSTGTIDSVNCQHHNPRNGT